MQSPQRLGQYVVSRGQTALCNTNGLSQVAARQGPDAALASGRAKSHHQYESESESAATPVGHPTGSGLRGSLMAFLAWQHMWQNSDNGMPGDAKLSWTSRSHHCSSGEEIRASSFRWHLRGTFFGFIGKSQMKIRACW